MKLHQMIHGCDVNSLDTHHRVAIASMTVAEKSQVMEEKPAPMLLPYHMLHYCQLHSSPFSNTKSIVVNRRDGVLGVQLQQDGKQYIVYVDPITR
jgi:hypothetical protein